MEIKYPGMEADWSPAYRVITDCIKKHLGSDKRGTKWERMGGDLSEYPTYEDEDWSKHDTLEDLLDSASGNTVATYMSGSGLRSEPVYDRVYKEVDEAIANIIRKANSHLPEDTLETLFENDRVWEWKNDQTRELLEEYKKESLGHFLEIFEKEDA